VRRDRQLKGLIVAKSHWPAAVMVAIPPAREAGGAEAAGPCSTLLNSLPDQLTADYMQQERS
jgi:hypothetical protein